MAFITHHLTAVQCRKGGYSPFLKVGDNRLECLRVFEQQHTYNLPRRPKVFWAERSFVDSDQLDVEEERLVNHTLVLKHKAQGPLPLPPRGMHNSERDEWGRKMKRRKTDGRGTVQKAGGEETTKNKGL